MVTPYACYQGLVIDVPEMLATLVANDRSDHEAARELASALEARAIVLAYKNGHVFDDVDLAPVIDFIRAFPSRRNSLQTCITAQRLQDGGAGALRLQFELVCRLAEPEIYETKSQGIMTREDAVRFCIKEGLIPASTTSWNAFCERVRDLADGWVDKKEGTLKRGFDDITIKRDVKKIRD